MNLLIGGGKEYEAKFLDINVSKLRKLIKENGGKLVHKRVQYVRVVYKLKNKKKGFARVRNENGIVTMTVKIYNNEKYPDEYELTIKEGFKCALEFMKSLGMEEKAFQESYREKYSFPKNKQVHEVTIDELPGIPPYCEIDCTTEKSLIDMMSKLKMNKDKMRYGSFDKTYLEYYGIPLNTINNKTKKLTFSNIKNEIKPTKNKNVLANISQKQKKY